MKFHEEKKAMTQEFEHQKAFLIKYERIQTNYSKRVFFRLSIEKKS